MGAKKPAAGFEQPNKPKELHAGWVSKLAIKGRYGRNWKRRYLVLFADDLSKSPYVAYFTGDKMSPNELRGAIPLSKESAVELAQITGSRPDKADNFAFTISFHEADGMVDLVCAVSSEEARKQWMEQITAAVAGTDAPDPSKDRKASTSALAQQLKEAKKDGKGGNAEVGRNSAIALARSATCPQGAHAQQATRRWHTNAARPNDSTRRFSCRHRWWPPSRSR